MATSSSVNASSEVFEDISARQPPGGDARAESSGQPVEQEEDDDADELPMESRKSMTKVTGTARKQGHRVFDVDLYGSEEAMNVGLQAYYGICQAPQATGIFVTTSCFTAWRNGRKRNGSAKVIPAVAEGKGDGMRVFFFDDNINLHLGGTSDADGICNLRDVATGKYVDFSVGANGFMCDRAFRHTCIHYSSQYRVVLIQANILDAMANVDYFTSIIRKYSKEGEKLIVFSDVNGTIVWDDTVSGKSGADVLMMTMFRFAEVRPKAAFDVTWDSQPPVMVDKSTTLRQLVSDIANKDNAFYQAFWCEANCQRFLTEICGGGNCELGWFQDDSVLTPERFWASMEST
jgi:hypothetical protein